ncbi:MAG: GPO family capsid scaffolding protein [Zoogloeaceae bacterium]|jgi:hypothetical protein|nr:GPO family capsid scaffolding protein [Zoogloeaceae bacterium]
MPLSKPFAVATEGQTIDGRAISRQQIEDMAKHYDPAVYTAVVNLEHLLSYSPDNVFAAYGKVVSLATRETEILGEKKLQLMAVADVSDAAAQMQKKGQKAFASIEMVGNFTGKGIAYMTGLALTDTPASLGTESMKFSAFSHGEVSASPAEIEFSIMPVDEAEKKSLGGILLEKLSALLPLPEAKPETLSVGLQADVAAPAEMLSLLREGFAQIEKEMAAMGCRVKLSEENYARILEALKTEDFSHARPTATGGNATQQTDC